jgi:hypothetical protein
MSQQQGGYSLGRKHRPLDDWSLRLWGDVAPGAEKPTFLYIDFRYGLNEEFRDIEVGINFRKSGKEGKIKAFPSQSVWYAVCDMIKRICKNPEKFDVGFARVYDNMTQMVAGRRVDTPVSDVKIVVGRDEEGVWISLAKRGHDTIKCRPSSPMGWVLRDAKGQPLKNDDISFEMGYSIATQWRNYSEHVYNHQYLGDDKLQAAKDKKKADAFGNSGQRGQGGGGFQQRPQQQSSGGGAPAAASADTWSAPAQDFDDDLPF